MKAVIAAEQGSPNVFKLVDLPKPEPGLGQVLVKVVASSVNPIDTKVRKAQLPMTPSKFPAVLQTDFSGVVESVGKNTHRFLVGDEVYGFAGGFKGPNGDVPGALSEYIAVDAELIALKPQRLNFRESAALPLVATTAWLALHNKVKIHPGTKILIQGGIGGVGHLALQLARLAGAKVFTTLRNDKHMELAKSFGAEIIFDSSKITPEDIVKQYTDGIGFDVIFDTVGGAALDSAFTMIRPAGDVITIVGAATHNLVPLYMRGANLHTVLVLIPIMFGQKRERQGHILDLIRNLVDSGHIKTFLDPEHFTLQNVADAHRKMESGQAFGKLIIDINLG